MRRGAPPPPPPTEDVEKCEEDDCKKRFLKKRTKRNADNTYHPSHNKKSTAEIPDFRTSAVSERDNETILMLPPVGNVEEHDIEQFKRETCHLPEDVAFRILSFYEYDFETATRVALQMDAPDLMPDFAKKIMIANAPFERDAKSRKRMHYEEFYFTKTFRKGVDTKTLVNFYYKEKNKLCGNWRLETPDRLVTPEDKQRLEEKMKASNITIYQQDPKKQTRAQKAMSTRLANLRRSRGGQETDLKNDSDATSVNSAQESTNGTPIPPEPRPPRINLKFRFTPSKLGTATPGISIISSPSPSKSPPKSTPRTSKSTPPKRPYQKRSLEQARGGAQKSYPARTRRATISFE